MSTSFQIQGELHSIGETTAYGQNGFTKREFVIKLTGEGENSAYPNYIAMEVIKEKCELMDQFQVGQEVIAHFNLNGRLWQAPGKPEKCFNSLQAWKVEALQQQNQQNQQPAASGYDNCDMPVGDDDDIPF